MVERSVFRGKGICDIMRQRYFNLKSRDYFSRKIEAALKMHGSIKEGFSFAQLSLYYLSVLTSTVHNVKMQAVVCEVCICNS